MECAQLADRDRYRRSLQVAASHRPRLGRRKHRQAEPQRAPCLESNDSQEWLLPNRRPRESLPLRRCIHLRACSALRVLYELRRLRSMSWSFSPTQQSEMDLLDTPRSATQAGPPPEVLLCRSLELLSKALRRGGACLRPAADCRDSSAGSGGAAGRIEPPKLQRIPGRRAQRGVVEDAPDLPPGACVPLDSGGESRDVFL
ncbi:MAG: hypothetical protein QOF89_3728 [Acidobacteriota bacterium]|nr:hypothetical protein [Acidobacteriota bacterium]